MNLFASRLKSKMFLTKSARIHFKDLWIQYAQEALGLSQYFPHKLVINYNSWFSDKAYRQSLAEQLNLEFTDSGFSDVPQFGGGSSFDSTEFTGQAQKMNVFNRWLDFRENAEFIQLMSDTRIVQYTRQLFELTPEQDSWLAHLTGTQPSGWDNLKTQSVYTFYPLIRELRSFSNS